MSLGCRTPPCSGDVDFRRRILIFRKLIFRASESASLGLLFGRTPVQQNDDQSGYCHAWLSLCARTCIVFCRAGKAIRALGAETRIAMTQSQEQGSHKERLFIPDCPMRYLLLVRIPSRYNRTSCHNLWDALVWSALTIRSTTSCWTGCRRIDSSEARLVPVSTSWWLWKPSEPEWLVLRSCQMIAASDSYQLLLVQHIWADDHLMMAYSFDATGKPEKLDFLAKTENQSRAEFQRHVSAD